MLAKLRGYLFTWWQVLGSSGGGYADLLNAVLIVGIAGFAVAEAVGHGGLHLTGGPVSEQTRDLLWFSLLCGLASFATIEVVKRLAGVRGLYQRRQTKIWLAERQPVWSPLSSFDELLNAMGGKDVPKGSGASSMRRQYRLFNLPTEQLAAQIAAAVDGALTDPLKYRSLLESLIGGGLPEITRTENKQSPTPRNSTVELAVRVRAGLDLLQISLAEGWRRYVQGSALWLSGLYGVALTYAGGVAASAQARNVLAALLVGGVFAWVSRDATAVVERLRR